jgi:hypothetical protein
MASGMRYAQLRLAPVGEILVFNLPPQTPQYVWDDVAIKLGDGSRPMTESDKVGMTLQQLRLNGSHAEVDVIYVTTDGVWQMATVHHRRLPSPSPTLPRMWTVSGNSSPGIPSPF